MLYPGRHEYGPLLECVRHASRYKQVLGALVSMAVAIPGTAVVLEHIISRPETPSVFHYYDADQSTAADGQLNVVEWNMHNQTEAKVSDIAEIIEAEQPDAIMLVETSKQGSQLLAKSIGGYVTHLNTDRVQGLSRGFGNAIWTSQKPKLVAAETIEGNSVYSAGVGTFTGLLEDVINQDFDLTKTKEGRQENRAALALTIQIEHAGEVQDVRLVVSHISAQESVHDRQTDELVEFLGSNIKRNKLTIFCGDTNSKWADISKRLGKVGFFVPQVEGFSSVNSNKTIDHCGLPTIEELEVQAGTNTGYGLSTSVEASIFSLAKAGVLKYETDHRPISISVAMTPRFPIPQNSSDNVYLKPSS